MVALQAFVFVVGGGNYIEYQNLQDYCRRLQNTRRVTYGTSELMNAKQFITQVGSFLLPLFLSLSFPHSLSLPLFLSLSFPHSLSPSLFLFLSLSLSLSLFLSLNPSHSSWWAIFFCTAGRTGKKWRIGNNSDHV